MTITDGRADRGSCLPKGCGTLALDHVVLRGTPPQVGCGLFNTRREIFH